MEEGVIKQNGIVMKYEEIEGGKEYRTPWNGVTYAILSRLTYAFVVCGVTYTLLLGIMYTFLLEVTYTFVCIRRVNMKVSDDLPDKEEYYDNESDNDNDSNSDSDNGNDNDSDNDSDNNSDNNNDNNSDHNNYQIPYFSHVAICRFRVNSCCKQFKRRVGI